MNIVLNLDKPAHITSQQAVVKVKRFLGAKKAGHAGTLDPLATGILIVCLNEATKITRFLSDLDKEYIVQLKLGERTDTLDSTGRITEMKDPGLFHVEDIRAVLDRFTGSIQQTPPMYSAVKIGGEPLYKLARKGIIVDRPDRSVHIRQMELLSFQQPYLNMRVTCSKGTYIRTLCDDIGNLLGTGAHMTALTRTRVGKFKIEDAVSLQNLSDEKNEFYSIDEALSHLEELILDHESSRRVKHGIPVDVTWNDSGQHAEVCETDVRDYVPTEFQYVRMKSPDRILLGIGALENNSLKIERIFQSS